MLKSSGNRSANTETPFEAKGYLGRIVHIVDMGLQPQSDWKTGEEKPSKYEVMVTLEFPTVRNDDDKPMWLSKRYAFPQSWPAKSGIKNNTNLYKLFSTLLPSELTQADKWPEYYFMSDDIWDALLDTACYVGVKMTNTGKPKVDTISTVPDFAGEVPALENPTLLFEVESGTVEQWKALFPWVREVISESQNDSAKEAAKKLNEALKAEEDERRQGSDDGPDAGRGRDMSKAKGEPDFDDDDLGSVPF